jgi:glycosyltransferase involved in cell wall biosynthesis
MPACRERRPPAEGLVSGRTGIQSEDANGAKRGPTGEAARKRSTVIQLFRPKLRSSSRNIVRARHVCMVVHSTYPVGEPRGQREALAAVEAGYTVDMVCLRSPTEEPTHECVDGIRILRLPVEHSRGVSMLRSFVEYVSFAFRAARAVMKINRRDRVDVVFVHAPPDFLIAAAVIPKLLGRGVVLDIHDLSPHMFEARFEHMRFAGLASRILRVVERGACALADRVVTVHGPYRDELVAHGVSPGKIAVVMNSPAPETIALARSAGSNEPAEETFLVAYHGTITHWYGVDLLVEAIAKLDARIPKLRGLIIGEGDALASARRLAADYAVDQKIEFSGVYIAGAEALRRVAAASCGVIPNRPSSLNRFALSSKLLEYVALGVPVVVSRLETLAAHFGADEVTFFEPNDAESLAEAIAWVAEHPAEAQAKSERAQRRAEDYSWGASRSQLLEAIAYAARRI